jgi:hypothetical protein
MARSRHLRVAVAVEPTVLGDALVVCLHVAGFDDVVNLGPNPERGSARYDAAVVSGTEVDADLVIDLRDETDIDGIVRRLEAAALEAD